MKIIQIKLNEAEIKLGELNRTLNLLLQKVNEVQGEKHRVEGELRVLKSIEELENGTDRDTAESKDTITG
jgi:hypothetical protein